MEIKLVAFDINGTLFDDTDIFWKAINGVFEHFHRQPLALSTLQKRFGQPWTKIYREEGLSEKIATDEELYKIYNNLYRNQESPKPPQGTRTTLQQLKKQGVILAIVSTQQNAITVPLLKKYKLDKLFSQISGNVADKAISLKEVFKENSVLAQNAAYVGDQEDDIKNAKRAGCVSVAFTGGLHSRERLMALSSDFVIDTMKELHKLPFTSTKDTKKT